MQAHRKAEKQKEINKNKKKVQAQRNGQSFDPMLAGHKLTSMQRNWRAEIPIGFKSRSTS